MSLLVVMPVPPSWARIGKENQTCVLKDSGPLVPYAFLDFEQLGLTWRLRAQACAFFASSSRM